MTGQNLFEEIPSHNAVDDIMIRKIYLNHASNKLVIAIKLRASAY